MGGGGIRNPGFHAEQNGTQHQTPSHFSKWVFFLLCWSGKGIEMGAGLLNGHCWWVYRGPGGGGAGGGVNEALLNNNGRIGLPLPACHTTSPGVLLNNCFMRSVHRLLVHQTVLGFL